jgi:3-deoxy-D-manno-octulosonic-acid transferase
MDSWRDYPLRERVYTAGVGLAGAALPLLGRGEGKLGRGVRGRATSLAHFERWARESRDTGRPLVLFHAPSAGEGLQAREVIEAFRSRRPDAQVAFTFFSPSAERIAAAMPADVAGYLPLDTPRLVVRLLDALRPSAIVFSKTEIWPNVVRLGRARRIPSALVNATLPPRSSRLRPLARALLRPAHARLARVAAISADDAARFRRLGVPPERISVMGDAHFDRVTRRVATLDPPPGAVAGLRREPGFTLVAGSTWGADEDLLLEAYAAAGADPSFRLLLVPHEPTEAHLSRLERSAESRSLSTSRLSRLPATGTAGIVLVDRVGILLDLYSLADAAYVGGGHGRAGLHSVLEPAAFGIPVLFGPRHENAREAGELILAGGAFAVTDRESLLRRLEALRLEPGSLHAAGAAARDYIRRGAGAAERGARMVDSLLSAG